MYLLSVDHRLYERRDGRTFGLAEALAEVRGTRNARIWRTAPDGSLVLVVDNAGSDCGPLLHAPTGRTINRRAARR